MKTTIFTPSTFDPATLFNPLMLWTDLAMKSTELMVASGQVFTDQLDQLARAGANYALMTRAWEQWLTSMGALANLASVTLAAQTRTPRAKGS